MKIQGSGASEILLRKGGTSILPDAERVSGAPNRVSAIRVASTGSRGPGFQLMAEAAAIVCRRGSRVNANAERQAPMPSENAPMKSHA